MADADSTVLMQQFAAARAEAAVCKKCQQRDGPAAARLWEDERWFVVAKGSPCCVCVTPARPRSH
jgi:hypothetical protein